MIFFFRYTIVLFFFGIGISFFLGKTSLIHANGLQDLLEDNSVTITDTSVPLPRVDSHDTPLEKINHIAYNIIEILLIFSGVIAVIFIVLGGVEYTSSAGVEDRLNGAKAKIQYALLGLVIVIFSYALLSNAVNFFEVAEG